MSARYRITTIDRDCQATRVELEVLDGIHKGNLMLAYVDGLSRKPVEGDILTFMEGGPDACFEGVMESYHTRRRGEGWK